MQRHLAVRAASGLLALFAGLAHAAQPEPYLRVTEEGNNVVGLDIAVRTFERDDSPVVRFVGAVHIGEPGYYQGLQELIERHDLVLYEGVGGAGVLVDPPSDGGREVATTQRLRLIAAEAARYEAEFDRWPTLDELLAHGSPAMQYRANRIMTDAFQHPVTMRRLSQRDGDETRTWIEFVSLGADGKPGGEGFDEDIIVSTRELSDDEIDPTMGIQPRMAQALGLVFQLEHMVFDRPHFVNSDMSVEEMMGALQKRGGDAEAAGEALMGAMGGESMMANIASAVLGIVERSPGAAVVARAIMADMLGQFEEITLSLPGGMGEMMEVILLERNNVIIEDLNEALETQPDLDEIAIIYGAGHLVPLEEVLVNDLGYRATGTEWRRAITADPEAAGVNPMFFANVRNLMRTSIEMQMHQARALAEQEQAERERAEQGKDQ